MTRAQGENSMVGGGYANKVFSNYGSVGGGFKNLVNARFGTVIGGARNTAKGRFSLAVGYAAVANQDHSASFGFDPSTICATDDANEVAFCCDLFTINGKDVFDMSRRRRALSEALLKGSDENTKEVDSLLATAQEHEKLSAGSEKKLADLGAMADRLLKLTAAVAGADSRR